VTDICNTATPKGRHPVHSPDDGQLRELVDALGFHARWRSQHAKVPKDCPKYLPIVTQEAVFGLLMGLACLACHQTRCNVGDPNVDRAVVFRRVQQDCLVRARPIHTSTHAHQRTFFLHMERPPLPLSLFTPSPPPRRNTILVTYVVQADPRTA
jgi:hypothetical protein